MASHRAAGRQSYVYGTAARDMAAERERTRERRVVQYRQNMSHTVRRNQEKALQMDLPYVLIFWRYCTTLRSLVRSLSAAISLAAVPYT